jgi:hypothetical protein
MLEYWSTGIGTFEYSDSIISFNITPSLQHSITPLPVDLKNRNYLGLFKRFFFNLPPERSQPLGKHRLKH